VTADDAVAGAKVRIPGDADRDSRLMAIAVPV